MTTIGSNKYLFKGNLHDGNSCHALVKNHTIINTKANKYEMDHAVELDPGVFYSPDHKKLIHAEGLFGVDYKVRPGTEIICDGAMAECRAKSITLAESVIALGQGALATMHLEYVYLNEGLKYIAHVNPMGSCIDLPKKVICKSPYFDVLNGILYTSDKTVCYGAVEAGYSSDLDLPKPVIIIVCGAFFHAIRLKSTTMHDNVLLLGNGTFSRSGLESVALSHSIEMLPESAFADCHLRHLEVTEHVDSVFNDALGNNPELESLTFDGHHVNLHRNSLCNCEHLSDVTGPCDLDCLNKECLLRAGIQMHTARRYTVMQHTNKGDEKMIRMHLA